MRLADIVTLQQPQRGEVEDAVGAFERGIEDVSLKMSPPASKIFTRSSRRALARFSALPRTKLS